MLFPVVLWTHPLPAVPLQQQVTQRIRHDTPDVLVQQSSSVLSTFTQVQRAGRTTQGTDASGGSVVLQTRWEGPVWVVTSHEVDPSTGDVVPGKAAITTARKLLDERTLAFDVSTCRADGAVVTASRVFARVSWDVDDVPDADAAQQLGTVAGSAWSSLFGSAAPGRQSAHAP